MSLGEHLRELRRRILLSCLGVLVGAVVGWIFYPWVFDLLLTPVRDITGGGAETSLNFADVMAAFDTKIRVSLFVGAIVSCPWWLAQFWLFVAPGLTRREKQVGLLFVGAGVPLFVGGAWLAWSVLPNAVHLLTSATPDGVWNLINAANYLAFVMQFMVIFGLAFLLPLVMVALTAIGVVRARTWVKGWRWAVLAIFVFAAFATPSPDAVSMLMLALPICGLYALALGVAWMLDRRRQRRLAAHEAELGLDPDPA